MVDDEGVLVFERGMPVGVPVRLGAFPTFVLVLVMLVVDNRWLFGRSMKVVRQLVR